MRELASRVWTQGRTPNRRLEMAASTSEVLARRKATYQDVLDAPAHQVAEIKDDDPISVRPFDAITFSLGDLWP